MAATVPLSRITRFGPARLSSIVSLHMSMFQKLICTSMILLGCRLFSWFSQGLSESEHVRLAPILITVSVGWLLLLVVYCLLMLAERGSKSTMVSDERGG
jgi:hypothetical protein